MKGLELIRRIFIMMLLSERPRNYTEKQYLELMWDLKGRQICAYRALREMTIPGLYLEGGVHPVEGINNEDRLLQRGNLLWARKADEDSYYDVEAGHSVYRLTEKEWAATALLIRKAQGNDPIA